MDLKKVFVLYVPVKFYKGDQHMLTGDIKKLHDRLKSSIPEARLIHDPLRTLAYGTDASFYRYIPKLIVKVESEKDVIKTLNECRNLAVPVTFRAAGTSLSGQACTDSVLIMLGEKGWHDYAINDDQSEITLQAGILGSQANAYLAPYGKKIGPDPASINSAKIGGIVANNACGMSSGVELNTMYTLKDMRLIFADGTILDTRNEHSKRDFLAQKKEWIDRVNALSGRLRSDPGLVEKIKRKYKIKNTTGYSVNALIEHSDPIKMIQHLMVGSEGTLAFISDVTFFTSDQPKKSATSLMLFPDIATTCEAVLVLRECNVQAAELIDRVGLRTVENKDGMPGYIKTMGPDVTALLVDTAGFTDEEVDANIRQINEKLKPIKLAHEYNFTKDPKESAALWKVRKGLFPSACSERPVGTTVIIEDIAVPIVDLGPCLHDLIALFKKYDYKDTVIWGHVLDGNVHFVIAPDFSLDTEIQRYKAFMNEVVDLVVKKFDGSLKAEHGTGRNMAPFVEREWGSEIFGVMKEIKKIFDPEGLINPGVMINEDPDIFIKNFKPMPAASEIVDTCIECGFCEMSCMSHGFTLSARQRIVLWREMQGLKKSGSDPKRLKELLKAYDYYGNQTCAADGLCMTTCPVEINTGKMIKELRYNSAGDRARRIAALIARNMTRITGYGRFTLSTVNIVHWILGSAIMSLLANGARKISGNRIPLWTPYMPSGAKKVRPEQKFDPSKEKIVYFPSCITRTMGPSKEYEEQVSLTTKTEELIRKAGYQIVYPENLDNLCCGMAFSSKGFKKTASEKENELQQALFAASENGKLPVLCDMSPCLHHMKETLDKTLKLYEPIEFTLKFLADKLDFKKEPGTVVVHAVCSAKHMGLEQKLMELAGMCSEKVVIADVNCCGFAGDRGFTYPELNKFGLRNLKKQIPPEAKEGFSTSRTCEIGLSLHGGLSYKSILYLVDRVTVPKR